MANYVAHHTKKLERLGRLQQDLLRSLRRGDPQGRQLKLAEDVRLAFIRVLRAERAEIVPSSNGDEKRYQAIDARISALGALSPEQLLATFVKQEAKRSEEPPGDSPEPIVDPDFY
jgi:hypothetical protein